MSELFTELNEETVVYKLNVLNIDYSEDTLEEIIARNKKILIVEVSWLNWDEKTGMLSGFPPVSW